MTGQKGLTVAIVALLITLCFGFLANVEETPSTRTVYSDQVNLEPLIYANSSRGSGTEFYNSIYNVTGWDNATVTETASANQYRLPSIETYINNPATSYNFDNYPYTTGAAVLNKGYVTNENNVYLLPDATLTNGEPTTGGFGGITDTSFSQYDITYVLTYQLNDTQINRETRTGFISLDRVLTLTDRLKVTNDGFYFNVSVYETSERVDLPDNRIINYNTVHFDGAANDSVAYIVWDGALEKWELYNASDNQIGTSNTAYIMSTETYAGTISTARLETSLPRYANPNQLVTIGHAEQVANYAKWSNTARDSTLINARVGVLITGNLDLYSNDTGNEVIQIRNAGGVYTITIGSVVSSIGAYSGLYVVMDAQNNTLTVNGVLSFSSQAPAIQYELTPFTYSVAYTFDSDRLTALYFNGQDNGKAYIANTWVYSDPAGILWNDFNLNLTEYFADRIAAHDGVRFSINGTTYYGSSLTINGQTFTVTNDKIKYNAIEGIHTVEYEKPINGLNVDFVNDHVILKFADGTEYDTGARTTYVIAGAGAWFFSAGLSDIDTVASISYEWAVGWSLDKNLTCALYLGILAVIFMLAAHYGRGQMGGFDYMIMLLAGVIALVIMA